MPTCICVFAKFFSNIEIEHRCNFVLSEVSGSFGGDLLSLRATLSLFALKVTQIHLRAFRLRTVESAIFASNVFSRKAM